MISVAEDQYMYPWITLGGEFVISQNWKKMVYSGAYNN